MSKSCRWMAWDSVCLRQECSSAALQGLLIGCFQQTAHLLVHRVRLAQGGKGEQVLAIAEMEEEQLRILVAFLPGGFGQVLQTLEQCVEKGDSIAGRQL